ncbi:hypothetical protein [Geothrix sp. 21YS21S-2]|uniref:hypothetical protein n=1 Tax=Geothrix sp. 21YS21S-2 TaxID=3068893 RepID=UPI0027BA7D3B|nr:hypothetical protein [Geothrix sp. 21YS21S-2]
MGSNFGGLAAADNNWLRTGVGKLFVLPYYDCAHEVGKVTVTAGGTGFTTGTAVTFAGGGTPTRQAQGTIVAPSGIITQVLITDPGAGYTTAPTCTATGGTGATLTPALGLASGPLRWLAPPAAPVFADYLEGFMQRLYVDPTTCKVLNPLVAPWGFLTADGFKPKMTQEKVEVDGNDGPKFTLAAMDTLIGGEFTFQDLNADHLADAFSTPAGNMISIAAATGKAGRIRMGQGSERILNKYILIYRMPSVKFLGEFDHMIIPRVTLSVDTDLSLAKGKDVDMKISFSSQAETSLISPINGEYCTHAFDFANAAAL